MKKITFILFALIAGTTFAQDNAGTDNASADVKADVVSAITIDKNTDLVFGKIITDAVGGTVIITNTAAGGRSGTADIVVSSPKSAAKFTITAEDGYAYSLDIVGTDLSITGTGTGVDMGVTYTPSLPLTGNINTDGTAKILYIGGTLTVGGGQAVGAYAGTVEATVAYE